MSTSTAFKLLPRTPYVASGNYHTDIFDVLRWKGRSSEDTWEQEVSNLTSSWDTESQLALPLLYAAARSVDELEINLQSKGELWTDCGFGATPAKPINKFSTLMLSKFLVTHLLDVLFWGCNNGDPTKRRLEFFTHQALQSNGWAPKPTHTAARFVGLNDIQAHKLLDTFLALSHTIYPSYLPPGQAPSASVVEVQEADMTGHPTIPFLGEHNTILGLPEYESSRERDNSTQGRDPNNSNLWEDREDFIAHASTGVAAMNSKSLGAAHQVSANIWVLATSLLFVLNVGYSILLHLNDRIIH